MAITYTPKFNLPIWNVPTVDGPAHPQFNSAFTNLDQEAAKDVQGLFSARPAAGNQGTYYWATDLQIMYRDNGTTWQELAGNIRDLVLTNSAVGTVPLSINAQSGTTANLITAAFNAVNYFQVQANGLSVFSDGVINVLALADKTSNVALSATSTFNGPVTVTKFNSAGGATGYLAQWLQNGGTVASMDVAGNFLAASITSATGTFTNLTGTAITGVSATFSGTVTANQFVGLGVCPAGTMMVWGGNRNTIPTGWLICQGTQLLQSAYPALYAAIGNTWGTAPAGYFLLPDMRERSVHGATVAVFNPGPPVITVDNCGFVGGSATHHHTLSGNGWANISDAVLSPPLIFMTRISTTSWTPTQKLTLTGTGIANDSTTQVTGVPLNGQTDESVGPSDSMPGSPGTYVAGDWPPFVRAFWIIKT